MRGGTSLWSLLFLVVFPVDALKYFLPQNLNVDEVGHSQFAVATKIIAEQTKNLRIRL
jgi:hypothetical protein